MTTPKQLPKISVWMIAYNHEKYIAQAIESVMMQKTNFDYELVIGEDCSTDGTRAIVADYQRRYPDRIRAFLREKNLGMMENSVRTLTACCGQYVAILEGDDYWTDTLKLQKQVTRLEADSSLAICFHNVEIVYDDGRKSEHYLKKKFKEISTIEDLIQRDFIPTCSTVFRNGLFKELPPWFWEYSFGDWTLHFLNAEHGNIAYLDEIMGVYRIHRGGVSSKGDLPDERRQNLIKSYQEVLRFYRQIDEHFAHKYSKAIAHETSNYSWFLAQLYDEVGDRGNVWRYLAKSIFSDPRNTEISGRHFARTVLNACVPRGFRRGTGSKPSE